MRLLLVAMVALAGLALPSCATQPAAAPAPFAAASILQRSDPLPGSTVSGPLNSLMLHFDPPARLDEVLVTGPDGVMPTMITAAGQQAHYSIPLPSLDAGNYTVGWRATANGHEKSGSFAFTVK